MSVAQQIKFQITIPNKDTPQEKPVISISVDSGHAPLNAEAVYSCTLEELFGQVAESYKHDKAALHQFSYYLLLHAKEFAQDDIVSVGDEETILKIQE